MIKNENWLYIVELSILIGLLVILGAFIYNGLLRI